MALAYSRSAPLVMIWAPAEERRPSAYRTWSGRPEPARTAQMITTTNSLANSESVPQAQSPRGAAASKASRSAT